MRDHCSQTFAYASIGTGTADPSATVSLSFPVGGKGAPAATASPAPAYCITQVYAKTENIKMLCQLESGLCQIVPHQTSAEHRRIGRTAVLQLRIQRDKRHIVGVQHPGQQQQQGTGQELRKRQPR